MGKGKYGGKKCWGIWRDGGMEGWRGHYIVRNIYKSKVARKVGCFFVAGINLQIESSGKVGCYFYCGN